MRFQWSPSVRSHRQSPRVIVPVTLIPWAMALLGILFLQNLRASENAALQVTEVPAELRQGWELSPFYQKHINVGGFPVLSSQSVSDYALREAAYLINQMLAEREDIRQALVSNKVRFAVMAWNEFTTEIPEHSTLEPAKFWDKRARGLGATRSRPAVSCGEENLLGFKGDPYHLENILIHEFAHAIHGMGIEAVDPTFNRRLKQAYDEAIAAGLWKDTYAAVNHSEYFAEGVQSWFECNRTNDAQHNHINTRDQLREYDPALAKLVQEIFGDRPWRYRKPAIRPAAENTHLVGFDPEQAPTFAWPDELLEWNRQHVLKNPKPEAETKELPLLPFRTDSISHPVATLRDSYIAFINRRSHPISLFELSPDGARKSRGEVSAGETRHVATYAGQTWLVVEGKKPIGMVIASFEPRKLTLK